MYTKTAVFVLVAAMLIGQFLLESPLWGFERQILRYKAKWLPLSIREMSPLQLSQYDGRDPHKAIYVGIDGEVFDVTSSRRMYGPGSTYNCFAGRDAARAFVTGCFETDLTHDLRGLTDDQLASLKAWKDFFHTHQKYRKVGNVHNPLIDPDQPLPVPCRPRTHEESAPPPIRSDRESNTIES